MMERPWEPSEFKVAFSIAILSLVCWGSWTNTAKAASSNPFPVYYLDYSLGVILLSVVAFSSLGAVTFPANLVNETLRVEDDWGQNFYYFKASNSSAQGPLGNVELLRIGAALGAGTIFNIANLLLVVAIQSAGLSMAMPVGIGTALVLGTVLTALIDGAKNIYFLAGGVSLAFVAVLAMARAHSLLQSGSADISDDEEKGTIVDPTIIVNKDKSEKKALLSSDYAHENASSSTQLPPQRSTLWKLGLCVLSGLLMSLWSPLSAYSMGSDRGLATYSSFLFFSSAVVVTSPVLLALQTCGLIPAVDKTASMGEYCQVSGVGHLYGILGGFIWGIGTLANSVSGKAIGFAVSYAVGQSAPLVATAWGVLYYREFADSSLSSRVYLGASVLLYGGAIAALTFAG
eukprot:m.346574 g.346574  ORF g.346574 m.346574 type:complete len:402 (+) comp29577_c0_seq1:71-1276(+)